MIKETLLESFIWTESNPNLLKEVNMKERSVTKLTEMVMKKSLENL